MLLELVAHPNLRTHQPTQPPYMPIYVAHVHVPKQPVKKRCCGGNEGSRHTQE
jgi:hypothetical protein